MEGGHIFYAFSTGHQMLYFEYNLLSDSQCERSIGYHFALLFHLLNTILVFRLSWLWPIYENMKSGGKDMRLTLWTVRIHVGYLLPSTTVKMLSRLWGNRLDGRISEQLMVSKLVPRHCYCTLSVHNDGLERSFNSRLEEMTDPIWAQTLSGNPYSYLSHWCFQGAISIY